MYGKIDIDKLGKHIKDPNLLVKIKATKKLGFSKNPKAIPYLQKALEDKEIAAFAAVGLAEFNFTKNILPRLIKHTCDEDPFVRGQALWALGELGDKDVEHVLQEDLNDKNACVANHAREALAKLQKRIKDA